MALVDDSLGALELSVIISVFLLGVVTVQTINYFSRFPNDRLSLKIAVAILWVLEILHSACIVSFLYTTTIINQSKFNGAPPVSITLALICHALSNNFLQALLTRRLYIVTDGKPLMPILLWFLTGISFCGFLVSLGLLLNQHLFGWAVATACFLSLNAIIYFLISTSLYFSLRTARREKTTNTQQLLRRLMIWTLVNGFVFTFAGIASVVLFLVRLNSVLWIGVLSVSQQFFSVSFLASLNARKNLRNIANTDAEDAGTNPISVINFARATRSSSGNIPLHIVAVLEKASVELQTQFWLTAIRMKIRHFSSSIWPPSFFLHNICHTLMHPRQHA